MAIRFKLKFSRKALFLFLALLVFFPPMSLSHLIRTSALWQGVNYMFKVGQLAFAALGILLWMVSGRREHALWFWLLILHMFGMLGSCVMNGSVTFDVFQRMMIEIGFCFLCAELYRKYRGMFIRSALAVFAVYTLFGVASIYAFPRGFNRAGSTYSALYGLGAKNNSFPFYFAFFFFLYIHSMMQTRQLPKKTPVLLLGTLLAGLICESVNTMLCLLLLWVLYYLVTKFRFAFLGFKPRVFFILFIAVIVFVYLGTQMNFIQNLLALFNRSTNFSGRPVLWQQAYENLADNPLFGAGYYSTFTLRGGTVSNHAHSQWMDKLAKYGIVPMIPLFIMLLRTFAKAGKSPEKLIGNMLAVLLLIYMLHMSFDTYNYNFFTICVIVINSLLDSLNARNKVLLAQKESALG